MSELDKILKENPFKVPEGYFENATGRILTTVAGIEREKDAGGRTFRIRPWMAAAASLAVIVVLSITFMLFSPGRRSVNLAEEISYNGYFEELLQEIDIFTLEEEAAGSISFESISGVDNSDIIDYLVLQNISVLDIYENL